MSWTPIEAEGPCEVCNRSVDDCICAQCPTCGGHGDPDCRINAGGGCTVQELVARAEGLEDLAGDSPNEDQYHRLHAEAARLRQKAHVKGGPR